MLRTLRMAYSMMDSVSQDIECCGGFSRGCVGGFNTEVVQQWEHVFGGFIWHFMDASQLYSL